MQRFASMTFGCLLALSACGDDNSDTATTDNNATTAPTTGADSSGGQATDPGTTTDAATTDVATTEPTTTDEPATGGGEACAPADDDDACATCVKDMCCDELEACAADPSGECQCFQACVETMPGAAGVQTCNKKCAPEGSDISGALVTCSATRCGEPCL